MFTVVVKTSLALLAVTIAVATSAPNDTAQNIADKHPQAPKNVVRNLTVPSVVTTPAVIRAERPLSPAKWALHRRKRYRRSLLRGRRRRRPRQEYYPPAEGPQYIFHPDQRESSWNKERPEDNAAGGYSKLVKNSYNPYPRPAQDTDIAEDDTNQRAEYDAEQTSELEPANREASAYDYREVSANQKRQAGQESVDQSRAYSAVQWKEAQRPWDQYRNKREYNEGSRDVYGSQMSYMRKEDGSKFFAPEEQESPNSFGSYAQEVVGQDGFVEHVGAKK